LGGPTDEVKKKTSYPTILLMMSKNRKDTSYPTILLMMSKNRKKTLLTPKKKEKKHANINMNMKCSRKENLK
jgi:hypothetical protein